MRSSIKRVLVAVDGSEASFETVRYVASVLPGERAQVVLFHVLNRVPETFWDSHEALGLRARLLAFPARRLRREEAVIDEFMERAETHLLEAGFPPRHVRVRVKERQAGVARDILREADKGYAALAVGRRGAGPLRDLVLGTTAAKLVNHGSRTPVWVVGEGADAGRILVAMDRSDCALRTLDYVTGYLGLAQRELLLFHAVRGAEPPAPRADDSTASGRLRRWLELLRSETASCEQEIMQAVFDRRIRSLERFGADVSRIRTRIVTGAPSRAGAVMAEAEKEGCGTIVLGRRGLSRVKEFRIGRVCTKVLQMARGRAVWVVQ